MRKKEEILRKKETTIRRQNPKENKRGKYIQSVIKNKKLLAIMLVLVLVVLAIIVASNQEIRKNVIQAFNGEIQNAEEDEKIEVYENGSAILTDDAAIITSASVANRTTGTAPFDTDDEPGNDSSPDNDVIRSFDKITWEIEANMEINNTGHGSEEANQYSQFRGGIINIEASLPEEYAGLVKWSLDDMTWAKKTTVAHNMDELKKNLEENQGYVKTMWCGSQECEDKVKELTGAPSRCIPFEQEHISDTCVCCGKKADTMVVWGRQY